MNDTVWAGAGVASAEEKAKVAVIRNSRRAEYLDIIHLEIRMGIQMSTVLTKAALSLAQTDANWVAAIRRNTDSI